MHSSAKLDSRSSPMLDRKKLFQFQTAERPLFLSTAYRNCQVNAIKNGKVGESTVHVVVNNNNNNNNNNKTLFI